MNSIKPRDANYTLRYIGLRAKHLYREKISRDLISLYNGLTDTVNSLMRATLGGVSVACYIAAEVCDKWKLKCVRKDLWRGR